MFVKKAGKYYLTLTDSQVSIINGLIHSRIYDLYAELRKDYPDLNDLNLDDALEVYPELKEKFVEYLDLQDYFVKNVKKSFLDLTLSDVCTLIGLLQDRQQAILNPFKDSPFDKVEDIPTSEIDEDILSELVEYGYLESKLIKYRDTFD